MPQNKLRVFVTGATGHTAKYFFQKLVYEKSDLELICALRKESIHKRLEINSYGLNIKYVECDLGDEKRVLSEHMQNVDVVLHIAGIIYSEKVLEAGKIAEVPWYVLIHTTGRYSKFKSASADYIEIEDGIIYSNSNTTILRPTLIYGSSGDRNMWRQIRALDRNRVFPVIGDGENLFQPVHAKDLGNAYYEVINNKVSTFGKQYNLSGGDQIKYIEMLRCIARGLDKRILFLKVPSWIFKIAVSILSRIPNKIYKCPINYEQVLRMNEDKTFSHENAKRDFGYNPMKFTEGIQIEIEEYLRLKNIPFKH